MKHSIIEKQIEIFQEILSKIVEKQKNDSDDFLGYVQKYFGFENVFGWNMLMNAFYVFEDTELAKEDFEKFGLQGSSQHKNIGEKYLRLYGVLNSLYQQNLALINLIELFKLTPKKEYINRLRNSDCIILRNKIASHSSNYINSNSKNTNFDVYEISRPDLENGKICLLKNQDIFETYDLNKAINNFNHLVQDILNELLKKFIKQKFNNQGGYYKVYKEIEELRSGTIKII